MGCCGPVGNSGMQDCHKPSLAAQNAKPQGVADQSVPPELAAFIKQLGAGNQAGAQFT